MFSNDKKPGGVSNWFLSLRRQPKKQKSLDSSKLLQKSCVDLTAAASSSEQDLIFRTAKPSKLKLNNNTNNNDDNSLTSNTCTNCCCKFSSKTSSPSFGVSPIDDEIEQTDQLRKVLITNEENYSAAGSTEQPTNFSSNLLLYNKKEEFTRTTRTLTTKVTSKTLHSGSQASSTSFSNKNYHHRIGLVFNENGQLLNRRQLLNTKYRDGLVFDENGRLLGSDSDETAPLTPASSILDDSNIEFIDSSSQNSDIQNRANMQQQQKCSCNGSKLTLTNSSSILSNSKSDWSSSFNNRQVIKDGRILK